MPGNQSIAIDHHSKPLLIVDCRASQLSTACSMRYHDSVGLVRSDSLASVRSFTDLEIEESGSSSIPFFDIQTAEDVIEWVLVRFTHSSILMIPTHCTEYLFPNRLEVFCEEILLLHRTILAIKRICDGIACGVVNHVTDHHNVTIRFVRNV